MKSSRSKRACAAAAFSLIVLAALAGGAGTGGAAGATELTVTLTGQIASVSPGGTAGYEAIVKNTGPSTVTQVTFVVETFLADAPAGTYRGSAVTEGLATCRQPPSKMLCTVSQLAPDEFFTVIVAFKPPAVTSPPSFKATGKATVSAQTQGNPGNKGTSAWFSDDVFTDVKAPSDSEFKSFSLVNDKLPAGTTLHNEIGLPPAFSNGHFGLVTAVSQVTGDALCDKCPTAFSKVFIPASLTAANPFGLLNPYTFDLTLARSAQDGGYKPAGLVHLDESGVVDIDPVPLCSEKPLSVDDPICLDAPVSQSKKGVVTAKGRGIENGSLGFD